MKLIACALIAALFVASGLHKIQQPKEVGAMIMKSPFPTIVNKYAKDFDVPFKVTATEAALLAQGIGATFVACSALLVFGIGRQFAATVLFLALIPITVFIHVNIADPAKTKQEDAIQVMKNLAIMGGLLFIACSGAKKAKAAPAKAKRE